MLRFINPVMLFFVYLRSFIVRPQPEGRPGSMTIYPDDGTMD